MAKGISSRQVVAIPLNRPGEGPTVDLIQNRTVHVNGQTVQALAIDMRSAPVPERKYLAETCDVRYKPSAVTFLFGQERIGKGELRSLLIIQMSPSCVRRFLSSLDGMNQPFDQAAKIAGINAQAGIKIAEEPTQTVALSASMVMSAMSNDEACLDFFRASPFAMMSAAHSKKLAVDTVVRVDLPSSLMLDLLEKLRQIAPQLPKSTLPAEDAEITNEHD
jgi:hypothetical protein